ncbi:MAG: hypothetical protein ABII88_02715 [Candidatus Omnitrophota bacterium]
MVVLMSVAFMVTIAGLVPESTFAKEKKIDNKIETQVDFHILVVKVVRGINQRVIGKVWFSGGTYENDGLKIDGEGKVFINEADFGFQLPTNKALISADVMLSSNNEIESGTVLGSMSGVTITEQGVTPGGDRWLNGVGSFNGEFIAAPLTAGISGTTDR